MDGGPVRTGREGAAGTALAIGAAVGAVIGLMTDGTGGLVIGLGVGAALGLVIGSIMQITGVERPPD